MHGTYALSKIGASKYSSGLACIQANPNVVKVTASHFQVLNTQKCKWEYAKVLNTQKANGNMPKMILIS